MATKAKDNIWVETFNTILTHTFEIINITYHNPIDDSTIYIGIPTTKEIQITTENTFQILQPTKPTTPIEDNYI